MIIVCAASDQTPAAAAGFSTSLNTPFVPIARQDERSQVGPQHLRSQEGPQELISTKCFVVFGGLYRSLPKVRQVHMWAEIRM